MVGDVNGNAEILACRKGLPAFPFRLYSTRRMRDNALRNDWKRPSQSCRIFQAAQANKNPELMRVDQRNGADQRLSPNNADRPGRASKSPSLEIRPDACVKPMIASKPMPFNHNALLPFTPVVKGLLKQPQTLEERGTTKKALAWSLEFEVRAYEKDSPPHLSAPPKQMKEQRPTPETIEAADRTAYQRIVHTANRERARLRAANTAEICPQHLPREASQA
jgi:hypothetical protein